MLDYLNTLDTELLLWLNHDGGAVADGFWLLFSHRFTWVPAYAAVLALLVRDCRHDSRRLIVLLLSVVALIALADQTASGLIKHWACRPRPSHADSLVGLLHHVGDYRGGRYGFVSSHAANTLAFSLWLSLQTRSRLLHLTLLPWTVANCYSRIYLGVHYPGDILGGLVVGAAAAGLVTWATRRLLPPTAPRSLSAPTLPVVLTFWATPIVLLLLQCIPAAAQASAIH